MPYIRPEFRERLEYDGPQAESAGELNFQITMLVQRYLKEVGKLSYADFNEMLGVLEAVKLELYRRKIAPYEDQKMQQNGDVYV